MAVGSISVREIVAVEDAKLGPPLSDAFPVVGSVRGKPHVVAIATGQ